jgi:hypothetical protein
MAPVMFADFVGFELQQILAGQRSMRFGFRLDRSNVRLAVPAIQYVSLIRGRGRLKCSNLPLALQGAAPEPLPIDGPLWKSQQSIEQRRQEKTNAKGSRCYGQRVRNVHQQRRKERFRKPRA